MSDSRHEPSARLRSIRRSRCEPSTRFQGKARSTGTSRSSTRRAGARCCTSASSTSASSRSSKRASGSHARLHQVAQSLVGVDSSAEGVEVGPRSRLRSARGRRAVGGVACRRESRARRRAPGRRADRAPRRSRPVPARGQTARGRGRSAGPDDTKCLPAGQPARAADGHRARALWTTRPGTARRRCARCLPSAAGTSRRWPTTTALCARCPRGCRGPTGSWLTPRTRRDRRSWRSAGAGLTGARASSSGPGRRAAPDSPARAETYPPHDEGRPPGFLRARAPGRRDRARRGAGDRPEARGAGRPRALERHVRDLRRRSRTASRSRS